MNDPIKPPAKSPCGTCPYRTDVPPAVWHPDEYAKLPAYDAETAHQPHGLFRCHQLDGRVCAGWAACHDLTHSLAVRLALSSGRLSPEQADELIDYHTDTSVFPTGQAAADHGMTNHEHPPPPAIRAIGKITARRSQRTTQENDQ